jgi:hypothetical protein
MVEVRARRIDPGPGPKKIEPTGSSVGVGVRARRVEDFWTWTRYFFTCLAFEKFFLVFTSDRRSKN